MAIAILKKIKEYPVHFELETIPLDQLTIDYGYQRGPQTNSLFIGDNYEPLAAGAIFVARRKNGHMVIMDGQQRYLGAKKTGYAEILCLVFDSTGPRQEARIFSLINGKIRKQVTPGENFKAALQGEVPSALKINEIVRKLGFTIHYGSPTTNKWPAIQAIRGLERIYKEDGAGGLESSLGMIKRIWESDSDALRESFVQGFWLFAKGEGIDNNRMIQRFKNITPMEIIRAAQFEAASLSNSGFARYRFIQAQLRDIYEHKT